AFLGLIRTPEGQRNQQAIADAITRTNRLLSVLEGVMADGRQYVAGDRFTMGDIAVGCAVDRWLRMPVERPETPAVAAYYERVSSRPSALGVLTQKLVCSGTSSRWATRPCSGSPNQSSASGRRGSMRSSRICSTRWRLPAAWGWRRLRSGWSCRWSF